MRGGTQCYLAVWMQQNLLKKLRNGLLHTLAKHGRACFWNSTLMLYWIKTVFFVFVPPL